MLNSDTADFLSTFESYCSQSEMVSQCCRRLLADFLNSASREITAQWFPIISDGGDSLAVLLGMDYKQRYLPFMISCGLIKITSCRSKKYLTLSQKRIKNGYTWDDFLAEFHLTNLEMSTSFISKYSKAMSLIRVGDFSEEAFNPVDQYKMQKVPSSLFAVGKLQVDLTESLAPILPLNIPTRAEDSTGDDNEPEDMQSSSTVVHNFTNLKTLLQVHFFDRIMKLGFNHKSIWRHVDNTQLHSVVQDMIPVFSNYFNESHRKNLKIIHGVQGSEEEEKFDEAQAIQVCEGKDPVKEFPVLHRFNIPLERHWISGILRDIACLSRNSVECDILKFQYSNQYSSTFIVVPQSANKYRFDRNAKGGGSWLENLLAAVAPTSMPNSKEVALQWLLTYIGCNYNDIFVNVCDSLGLLLNGKKMDAESAAAMWEAANVNINQQRTILKYMAAYFGRRLTVPESYIRELEEGALMPITGDFTTNEKKKINYWYKDLDAVILHRLKWIVKQHGIQHLTPFDRIFIILGGDTGGRMFRCVVKMVLYSTNTKKNSQFVMKVGHINCDKDTRFILENTIGMHLNNGLKRLVSKYVCIGRAAQDREYNITLADENPVNDGNELDFFSTPLSVKITGDLAFLSTALGKENMSGHWCPWCKLAPAEWSVESHAPGEKWTIEKLILLREELEEAARNNVNLPPSTVKGCTEKPLLDAVPIEDYVIPILHILIGMGNRLIASVFEWIKARVEKWSPQQIAITNLIYGAQLNYDRASEDFNTWIEQDGILLTEKQIEKKCLKDQLSEKDDNGRFIIHDRIARRQMNDQIKFIMQEIKVLQLEKKQVTDTRMECSKQLSIIKADAKKSMEALGTITYPISDEIEDKILKSKHGITKSHYHGGEYNGKGMLKLMTNADTLMKDFCDYIVENIPENERASNIEVQEFTSKYSHILLVFDRIFSTARASTGSLNDDDIALLVTFIQQAMVLWQKLQLSVTPKVHALEDHLVEQLLKEEHGVRLRGIGEFTEDFVEQAHQFGFRDEVRTRGLKDHTAKARSHSNWEHRALNPAVQQKHKEVASVTSRKRKRGANGMTASDERKETKKSIKNDSRIAALASTVAYVNNNELSNFTGEKRNFNDYKIRQDAAAALHQLVNTPLENNT
jgi:hypothetical protein